MISRLHKDVSDLKRLPVPPMFRILVLQQKLGPKSLSLKFILCVVSIWFEVYLSLATPTSLAGPGSLLQSAAWPLAAPPAPAWPLAAPAWPPAALFVSFPPPAVAFPAPALFWVFLSLYFHLVTCCCAICTGGGPATRGRRSSRLSDLKNWATFFK